MWEAAVIALTIWLLYGLLAVYAERKTAAYLQNRLGPYEVGPFGLWQPVADLLKLLQKQSIALPHTSPWHRYLFSAAPILAFITSMTALAAIPLWSKAPVAMRHTGVLFVLMALGFKAWSVLLAGWASQNKYAWYGAFRSIGQVLGYEVLLGLVVLAVALVTGTLDFAVLAQQQALGVSKWLFGVFPIDIQHWGGVLSWHIVAAPVLLPMFVLCMLVSLAMAHRVPFDLPEAESELVGGYHTEYSGWRWALFMLSEYGVLWVLALLMCFLFFGAWHSPLPNIGSWLLHTWTSGTLWAWGWLLGKSFLLIWIQMLIRWSLPRVRMDQWVALAWKGLIPAALVWIVVIACLRMLY